MAADAILRKVHRAIPLLLLTLIGTYLLVKPWVQRRRARRTA